jgi:hypothetical protein
VSYLYFVAVKIIDQYLWSIFGSKCFLKIRYKRKYKGKSGREKYVSKVMTELKREDKLMNFEREATLSQSVKNTLGTRLCSCLSQD